MQRVTWIDAYIKEAATYRFRRRRTSSQTDACNAGFAILVARPVDKLRYLKKW